MESLKRQVGGDHYKTLTIQPWEIIDACGLDFYEGNAVKYILRRKDNRIEDLLKAIHYLEHEIELGGNKRKLLPVPESIFDKLSEILDYYEIKAIECILDDGIKSTEKAIQYIRLQIAELEN